MISAVERERRRDYADRSRREAERLIERDLQCPNCGYKIGVAFSDSTGHIKVKCQKCKTVSVLNLAYFRRQRRRPHRQSFVK